MNLNSSRLLEAKELNRILGKLRTAVGNSPLTFQTENTAFMRGCLILE